MCVMERDGERERERDQGRDRGSERGGEKENGTRMSGDLEQLSGLLGSNM